MTQNTEEGPADRNPRPADGKYLAAVGGLLLLICAALATLWILERRKRVAAETEVVNLRGQLRSQSLLQAMGGKGMMSMGMMPPHTRRALEPVRRESLAVQSVDYAGGEREVLLVPADVGRRLGFEVGDLILISPPPKPRTPGTPGKPASAPSSKPS